MFVSSMQPMDLPPRPTQSAFNAAPAGALPRQEASFEVVLPLRLAHCSNTNEMTRAMTAMSGSETSKPVIDPRFSVRPRTRAWPKPMVAPRAMEKRMFGFCSTRFINKLRAKSGNRRQLKEQPRDLLLKRSAAANVTCRHDCREADAGPCRGQRS